MESVDLTLAEEALWAISRMAIERKTGARGLRSIMEIILLDTMFELPSLEGVEEVVISKQVVEGNRAAALYLRRPLRSYRRRKCLSPASADGQGGCPFSWPAARQGRPSFGDYRERSLKCGIGRSTQRLTWASSI